MKITISRILRISHDAGGKITNIVFDVPLFVAAEGVAAKVVVGFVEGLLDMFCVFWVGLIWLIEKHVCEQGGRETNLNNNTNEIQR